MLLRLSLVLRKETERREGLGKNVLLSNKSFSLIADFLNSPKRFEKQPVELASRPSEVIISHMLRDV